MNHTAEKIRVLAITTILSNATNLVHLVLLSNIREIYTQCSCQQLMAHVGLYPECVIYCPSLPAVTILNNHYGEP